MTGVSDRPELELVDEATAAMRDIIGKIRTDTIEIRNGREAAEVLRALNEVRTADDNPKVQLDRLTIINQALEVTGRLREQAALHEAVPVPEIPILDAQVVERPHG